jgi:hypothetical protein
MISIGSGTPAVPGKNVGDMFGEKHFSQTKSKYIFTLTTIFFALLSSSATVEKLANGGLKINNGHYEVELLNPNRKDFNTAGCRFIRGGWLKSLKLRSSKQSLIVSKTVFPKHPAFGFTFAFYPALKLKDIDKQYAEYLKVGVGTVRRDKTKNRFHDRPVKTLSWQYKVIKKKNSIQVNYVQDSGKPVSGYAWLLTQNVEFLANSIIFRQALKNTGSKTLIQKTYPHPFFNAFKGKAKCKFILPRMEKNKLNITPLTVGDVKPGLIVSGKELPVNCRWVAALNLADNNAFCRISTKEKLSRTQFWRNIEGCFAVELFIDLIIPPGKKHAWEWRIDFGRGPVPEKLTK